MAIKKYVFGSFQTNCYVVTHDKKAVVIDPGLNSDILKEELKDFEILAILITHAHIDHIDGIGNFNCPIYISELDRPALFNKDMALYSACRLEPSYDKSKLKVITFKDNEDIIIDEFKFHALITPGHTLGGACYQYKNVIFTGDTLFRCSIGRTDFYGGSEQELTKSLTRLVEYIKEDMRILPGHEEETDIKFEKRYNPYIKRIISK